MASIKDGRAVVVLVETDEAATETLLLPPMSHIPPWEVGTDTELFMGILFTPNLP